MGTITIARLAYVKKRDEFVFLEKGVLTNY